MNAYIKLNEFSPGRKFLSGTAGELIYPQLIEKIVRQNSPYIIFLDFVDITVSGSFFSQAVLPLRTHSLRSNAYVVLCNLDNDSRTELEWFMESINDGIYICVLYSTLNPQNIGWIGNLDLKQRLTFKAVLSLGECDAAQLKALFPDEEIGITGWNNRLSSLNKKGILIEIKIGRNKRYRPVLDIDNLEV